MPSPVSTPVLVLVIVVETAALATVSGLWLYQRRRAAKLEAAKSKIPRFEQKLAAAASTWAPNSRATLKALLETASLVREKGVGGAIRDSIEELAGWAQVERPDLARLAARDGTVTIFFSDIEDSTVLNERLGDKDWLKVLDGHNRIVQREVSNHDGHIIKSQGDGFMIGFALPAGAMRCAIGIQRSLATGDRRLRGTLIRVRIGIHAGVAVERGGDLFGRNVALAARVAALAAGGQILVTSEVSGAVGDGEFNFTDPGRVELRGLTGDHGVQTLMWQT